jgi:hypothetical protein
MQKNIPSRAVHVAVKRGVGIKENGNMHDRAALFPTAAP